MEVIVRRKLAEARKRLVLADFFRLLPWALVAGACLAVAYHLQGGGGPGLVLALALPAVVSLAISAWRWRSASSVAMAADTRAEARDRFVTLLGISEFGDGAMAGAVRREASAFLDGLAFGGAVPLRMPVKPLAWLAVPLGVFFVVQALREAKEARLRPEIAEAEELIEKAREATLAQAAGDKELEKLAAELEKRQAGLRDSSEPMRDALRALADLERALGEGAQPALDREDAKALAEALSGDNPAAARELESGNLERAAEEMARMDPSALAQAIEDAARHRESKTLRELSESGDGGVRLMRGMRSGGEPGEGGARGRLRSAVRGFKEGQGDAGQGEGQLVRMEPNGKGQSQGSSADNAPPGGSAGSEKDPGRGSDLVGEGEVARSEERPDEFLTGEMGDGSSMVRIFRAAGADDAKARRAYRAAWEAAAPAALDAVSQENIPPGSRLLVRKYFESIRPKE